MFEGTACDVIKEAAYLARVPTTHIGLKLGKSRQYIGAMVSNKTSPTCRNMAAILGVCGYRLCAVKEDELTESMLVINQ